MNPLILTLSLLMFIATLVTSEVKKFTQDSIGAHFYSSHRSLAQKRERETAASLFHELKATIPEPVDPKPEGETPKDPTEPTERKSPSLGFNLTCPPNNSRLNLYFLLHAKDKNENSQISQREIFAELLSRLYGSSSFFQLQPKLGSTIIDALIVNKEATKDFQYADELASIDLGNELAQKAFATMFQGGLDERGTRIPSLLDYVTFDKNQVGEARKINLMFASRPVLEAVFRNSAVTEELIRNRDHLWKVILDQEEHRLERMKEENLTKTEIKEDHLIPSFEKALNRSGFDLKTYKPLFDFTLGKQGSYLMMTDPKTGMPIRAKLPRSTPLKAKR